MSRVQDGFNIGRTSQASVVQYVQILGIPILENGVVSWGDNALPWSDVREKWSRRCPCRPSHPGPGLCTSCGLASPLPALAATPACYLCNRTSQGRSCCHVCGLHFHPRQQCLLALGAHPLYHASFFAGGPICPECVWSLSLTSSPSEPSMPHEARYAILARQRDLAQSPCPAAGSNRPPSTSQHDLRSLTRLINRGTPSSPLSIPSNLCPSRLQPTLEAAIRSGDVIRSEDDSLCLRTRPG